MTRFKIDDPEIDVEELEARVNAAIERKRGVRFTDRELDELRTTPLQPRLRREDLPRAWIEQIPLDAVKLPTIESPPGPVTASPAEITPSNWEAMPLFHAELPDPNALPVGCQGVAGAIVRLLRRLTNPLYRATLQPVIRQLVADRREVDRALFERINRGFDLLKDRLDQRIDATGDWAGAQLSDLTGRLERRHERLLHLVHNLVFELTAARLNMEQMQDRINDLGRRLDTLKARQSGLEKLTLEKRDDS